MKKTETIKDYQVLKSLSENYIGGRNVYLAVDTQTKEKVILKEFKFGSSE